MQDLNLFKSRIDGKIPNEFEWPINVTEVCSTFDKVVSVAKGFSEKIGRLTASNTKENGDNQNWKRYSFGLLLNLIYRYLLVRLQVVPFQ